MSDEHVFGLDEIKEENNKFPLWLAFVWVCLLSWGGYYLVTFWSVPTDKIHKEVVESTITFNRPISEDREVKSSPAGAPEQKTAAVSADNNEMLLADGKVAFEANCAACHGMAGDGKGPAAAALTPPPRNFIKADFKYGSDDASLTKTIMTGVKGTAMPAWKGTLTDDQIKSVLTYIKKFKK